MPQLLTTELSAFIVKIQSQSYNSVQYNKLGLEKKEEFLDPITDTIMDCPVTLHGQTFDFDTLDLLDVNENGIRLNPFTRQEFKMLDASPNKDLYKKIRTTVEEELSRRFKIVERMCRFAQENKTTDISDLLSNNPEIKINDLTAAGCTALHYACSSKNEECIKFLIDLGADLCFSTKQFEKTPYKVLYKKDPKFANNIKDYFTSFLQQSINRNPENCIKYATLFLEDNMVSRDVEKAFVMLDQAHELGSQEAHILCGDIYLRGLYDVESDYKKAEVYYRSAFDKYKSPKAKIKLAIAHHVNSENKDSRLIILDLMRDVTLRDVYELARKHDPEAQFLYSLLLILEPDPSPSNLYKSYKFLKLAVSSNLDVAQYLFATSCSAGTMYIPQSDREAAKYFKLAADQGLAAAQNDYGACCFSGKGVTKSLEEAAKYFELAANQGHAKAQYGCGMCYRYGQGVEQSYLSAETYLRMAANNQYMPAQHALRELNVGMRTSFARLGHQ